MAEGAGPDFFISYTGADVAWARWIAVELEAAGYTTLSQALDFRPGQDFVHKIQCATEGAARTIAVLSPEYVESRFGEAEWRAAFVSDPSGERGLLVPVRVSRCEPSGVLGSRVYIELVGVDEPTARQRLREGVGPPPARPTSAAWPGRLSNDLHPDTASVEAKAASRSFPGDDPMVTNLPGRHRAFIGRDALLDDLATALCSGSAVVAVTGIGGVGKSSVAREYAHRHRDLFDVVWWVPAENATLIPGQLAELAHTLEPASAELPVGEAVVRLREFLAGRGRWLLVFDNAGEDPRDVAEFLPDGPGQVLITSRSPTWQSIAVTIPVAEFTRDESVHLLRRLSSYVSELDTEHVAEALGDLPLAVEQAGSMLADTGLDVPAYLQLLTERADELLAIEGHSSYPASIAASWAVAFDRLAADNSIALDMLTLLAWCAPEPVPLSLLTDYPDALPERLRPIAIDPLLRAQSTRTVNRRGMATLSEHGLQLHRIPAALLRARTKTNQDDSVAGAAGSWPAVAIQLLHAAAPAVEWGDISMWPIWRQLLPHVLVATEPTRISDPVIEQAASLLDTAASYLSDTGQPRAALLLYERSYGLYCARLGEESHDALMVAENLDIAIFDTGDYQRAREFDENLLPRCRRVLGHDHPTTLSVAHNLGRSLRELGEHRKAYALHLDTLEGRRRVLGLDHRSTLISAAHVAANLRIRGEYSKAREIDEETLSRCRQVFGYGHPTTLAVTSGLADDLRALGEEEQALGLDMDTLERYRRIFGDDHPSTRAAATRLANAQREQQS